MPERFSDEQVEAAIAVLREPGRLAEAEAMVASAAPQLQMLLADALQAGGWFEESHDAAVLKAATTPNDDERLAAVRTLLAEETRMGMMVGVAVGWSLRDELTKGDS